LGQPISLARLSCAWWWIVRPLGPAADNDYVGSLDWPSASSTISSTIGSGLAGTGTVWYNRFDGRTVAVHIEIAISANGTGSGAVSATLPFVLKKTTSFYGRNGTTGSTPIALGLAGTSVLYITNYDNSYPGATGQTLNVDEVTWIQ
jgi:hypothetical protein